MAIAIKMPKMSDTMTEGVVRKWNYKIGDTVKSGDILAEVETDKATMDLENYEKGTILHFAINEGDAAPVDSIIAIVGAEGEDFKVALNAVSKTVEVKKDTVILTEKAPTIDPPVIQNNTHNDTRLKASPLAKKLAEEKGIDLTSVAGSAENEK